MAVALRIRVLVTHGDPVVQAGLSVAFGRYSDLEVQEPLNPVTSPASMTGLLRGIAADVVVADYATGLALAAAAARQGTTVSSPKIIVVGGINREWEIRRALEYGVRGYLLIGCALDELAAGVRAVHRGARHLNPQVAARLAESVSLEPLTAREEEVLRLVVEGLCNKAIGRRLGIAVGTVKSHLKSAFDKLDVESRTQAVAAVERRGLLRQSVPSHDAGVRSQSIGPAGRMATAAMNSRSHLDDHAITQ